MTNKEINEAVARKLGKPIYIRHGIITETITPEMAGWQVAKVNGWFHDYCTSIAAAWEVVETNDNSYPSGIMKVGTKWLPIVRGRTCSEYAADTAPMAICLAFLKVP